MERVQQTFLPLRPFLNKSKANQLLPPATYVLHKNLNVPEISDLAKITTFFLLPHRPPVSFLCQDVTPLATPDHQGDHGQREKNGDEDEDGQHVVRRVHQHLVVDGAVGEKVLVYADDVALYQRVGPIAVHPLRLFLCAQREEVVLTGEGKGEGRD